MGICFSIFELLFIIVIFGFFVLLVKLVWDNWNGLVEVFKMDDWQCFEYEECEYIYFMFVGKVMVMQMGRCEECVYWKWFDCQGRFV